MTKRKAGGYAWRQELTRAVNANKAAREALRRIVDERPGPQTLALLIAKAATALAENLEALREIEQVGVNQSPE
jgi:hypothetical protein